MSKEFAMIAKTFQGLEEVLAEELIALGANDVEIGRRMVSFSGDKEMMYKANFCLRTAIRILKPIKTFTAKNADEVYEQIKAIEWDEILDVEKSFAIDSVVFSQEFRHSKFVAYRVKDAIVDYFKESCGKRPSVRINRPDVLLNIHIAETSCTLSLDSSGESLHRRGYRQEAVEAPLNEVLAAGIILKTGWKGESDLIDPMCGSGTFPIEAALIARNIAPGIFRKEFAFEKWVDFDQNLFDMIYNDESQEREFDHHIFGYDNSPSAIEIATHNVKAAGVAKDVIIKLQPIQQFEQPKNKALMITNPPYGERISTENLLGLYEIIGERLKHAFCGNTAWILSYRKECFDAIGLRQEERLPLYNGALECELRKYEIFDGKMKEFKHDRNTRGGKPFAKKDNADFARDRMERRDRKEGGEGRRFNSDRKFGGERKFNSERRSDSDKKFGGERKFNSERRFDSDKKFGGERKYNSERRFDSDKKFGGERKFNSERRFDSDKKFGGERKFNSERKFDSDKKPSQRKRFNRSDFNKE